MKKFQKRYYFYFVMIIILTLGFSISLQSLIAAWSSPAYNPPQQNNIGELINSGGATQSKTGIFSFGSNLGVGNNLTVANSVTVYGSMMLNNVRNCSGKLYTNSSGQILCGTDQVGGGGSVGDNLGNHSATRDLDLNGRNIVDGGIIYASNMMLNNVRNCSGKLYTNSSGQILCGTDQIGSGGSVGDNLGNHSATRDLVMNGYKIKASSYGSGMVKTDTLMINNNSSTIITGNSSERGTYIASNVWSSGPIESRMMLKAPYFIDSDGTTYNGIDPSGTSRLNTVFFGNKVYFRTNSYSWTEFSPDMFYSLTGMINLYKRIGGWSSGGASGDITAVYASSGLTGGGTSGSVTLRTNAQTCGTGYYSYWDGSSWRCRRDETGGGASGDITAVYASSGLTGGGTSGSVTLRTNAQTCGTGYYSYWNGSSWRCRRDETGGGSTSVTSNYAVSCYDTYAERCSTSGYSMVGLNISSGKKRCCRMRSQ